MVKIGTLKDYKAAQKKLKDAGYTITENSGNLVKKTFVDGVEAISIGRFNAGWIFRYNSDFFKEAK